MEFMCSSFGRWIPKDKTVCTPTRPGNFKGGTKQNGGHYDYFCPSHTTLCTPVVAATVTFTIFFDKYPSETSASLYDRNTGEQIWCYTNGYFVFVPTYTQSELVAINLPAGDYYFGLGDSYGDGLKHCSTYPSNCTDPAFTMKYAGVEIFRASNNNFGYLSEVGFTVSAAGDVAVYSCEGGLCDAPNAGLPALSPKGHLTPTCPPYAVTPLDELKSKPKSEAKMMNHTLPSEMGVTPKVVEPKYLSGKVVLQKIVD